jgi:capsule polysaccharide export protein KpsE/RkpR
VVAFERVPAQIITEFIVEERFDTVNLLPERATTEQLERFGREVIPLVRASGVR